jgi:hypothetical protein
MLGGCSKKFEVSNNYFFIKATDTLPREYYEAEYIGNSVTKTVCGKNVTAAYEKTIYKALGDITKYSYLITAIEGENDTSDLSIRYIELDDKGNVIGGGGELGYIDIKCQYGYDQDHILDDGYSFGVSKEDLRAMAEEALGYVVDWSLYNQFSIEFSLPLEFQIGLKNFAHPMYISASLTWRQRIAGEERDRRKMGTQNTVMCTLNFASWNKTTGHTFLDNSNISEFHIETALSEKNNLPKFVDRAPISTSQYWSKLEEHLNESVTGNEERLTVYNGKVCYFVRGNSYILIVPLE